jgi:serralysin
VVVSLANALQQTVHTNRSIILGTDLHFESVIGGSGNDTLFGNAAGNSLTGNSGHDILVGADGDDQLLGGAGRDILIGGLGIDALDGGDDDDILIAGSTASDLLAANLNDVRSEWISETPYETKISNIRSGVGATVTSLQATVNVLDDSGAVDTLTGGAGTDWFFQALDDVIADLFEGEIIDPLSSEEVV